jgi:hypothetical protein
MLYELNNLTELKYNVLSTFRSSGVFLNNYYNFSVVKDNFNVVLNKDRAVAINAFGISFYSYDN